MRNTIFLLPLIALAILVGGVSFYYWHSNNEKSAGLAHVLIGKKLPEFGVNAAGSHAAGFESKDIVSSGRPGLVNFFASWCVPCLAEHEVISWLSSGPELQVYGVAFHDKPIDTSEWLAEHGNPFDMIGHDSGDAALAVGVRGVPETFGFDQNGVIRYHFSGPMTKHDAKDLLEALALSKPE